MKQAWMAVVTAVAMVLGGTAATLAPTEAEAKRLGGGKSQGMQRSTPAPASPTNSPTAAPPTQGAPAGAAAAAPAAAGAAAAAGKRSWMGPIAGLAAGLGLAALMSHLGMGEQFANFLMLALLAVAVIFLVRFLMGRFAAQKQAQGGMGAAGLQPAGAMAGAGGAGNTWTPPTPQPVMPSQAPTMQRSAFAEFSGQAAGNAALVGGSVPADFDSAGFERIAKMIFIRMQTANDSGDLNDLRNFTTPEMFAAIRLELQERGEVTQHTDVVKVDAEVLDVSEEADRQIVSVRFHGRVREESDATETDFDEIWHLVKPNDDSRPWAIAGIQQR